MRQAGLSLVELMIGLTIGLLLTVGLVTMIAGTSRTFQIQDDFSRMQENGSLALHYLGDDIRMAGFYGTATTTSGIDTALGGLPAITDDCGSIANPPDTNWAYNTDVPLRGFTEMTATAIGTTFPCIAPANFQRGQLLVVRRGSGYSLRDPDNNGNLSDAFTVAQNPNFATTVYIQSEPAYGLLFLGANYTTLRGENRIAVVGGANPVDAPIFQYYARVYYIRPCSRPVGGTTCSAAADGGRPIPTLARRELSGNAMVETPLIEGVERISFLYGVDSTPAVGPNGIKGDGVPERFVTDPAAAGLEWTDVVSVRVAVLVRSPNQAAGYNDSTKEYDMGDGAVPFKCTDVAAPACSYKRKLFVQTFQMRNVSMRRGT